MSSSTAALAMVSGAALLAGGLAVRTLLARRVLRRRLEALAVRLGAGATLPARSGLEVVLSHLERAAGHAQETVTQAHASGLLLARALDGVSQGVLVCDEQGKVVYRNHHLSALIGRGGGGPLVAGVVEELAAATGHDRPLSRTVELPGRHHRELRIDAFPIDDGQRTLGVVAVVRDVSSDRAAAETRRDFLADVREELALPAATIRTLAELLLEQDGGMRADHLPARIHAAAGHLARTVEDLVLLHRAEVEPHRASRPVPVDVVVDQALARVRPEASQRDVSLEMAPAPEAIEVAGDRGQLVAALSHLVRTAVDCSPDGSRVHVRPARADRFAEITVEDDQGTSPGTDLGPPGGWPRVDGVAGNGRAAGLGFAIARTVAESHGGTVDLRAAEEGGVCIVLRLPVASSVAALDA